MSKILTAAAMVAATAALSGCVQWDSAVSAANTYASAEIKAQQKNIQGINDNAAAAWADAGCAIPYGEMVRNGSGNPNMPAAVVALCGAPSGFTMTHTVPTTQAIQVPTVQMAPQLPATAPAAGQ